MPNISEFNAFQRELNNKNVDERMKYFLTMIKEELNAVNQANEEAARAILALAHQMEAFVELHARTQEGLQTVRRHVVQTEGVDVMSVVAEPEETKQ